MNEPVNFFEWFIAIPLAFNVLLFWRFVAELTLVYFNNNFYIGWLGSIDFETHDIEVWDWHNNYLARRGKIKKIPRKGVAWGTIALQLFGVWFLCVPPLWFAKRCLVKKEVKEIKNERNK